MVGQLEASGLSVSQFATRHDVSARTLAWWRWKVRQGRPRDDGLRFVELTVERAQEPAPIRLRFERFGMEIQVHRGFDPELLRTVVGALC